MSFVVMSKKRNDLKKIKSVKLTFQNSLPGYHIYRFYYNNSIISSLFFLT